MTDTLPGDLPKGAPPLQGAGEPAAAPTPAAPPPAAAPRAPGVAVETASDVIGMPLSRQLPLTIWHSVVFTPRVARDMMERTGIYLPPVRMFMILIGLLLGLGAFFQLPLAMDLGALFPPDMHGAIDLVLRDAGTSLAEARAETGRWMSLIYWVMMAVAAFPFLLLLKALRPGLSWWVHLQGYLIANNAMLVLSLAGAPLLLINTMIYMVVQLPVVVMFYVAMVRIASGAYEMRRLGVTVLLAAMLPLTLVSYAMALLLNMVSLHVVLTLAYDISLIDLINAGGGVDAAGDTAS